VSVPLVAVGTTPLATSLVNLALLEPLAPLVVAADQDNLAVVVDRDNLAPLVVAVVAALLVLLVVLHRVVRVNLALLALLVDRDNLALLVVEVPAVNLGNLERLVTLERLDNLDNLDALVAVVVTGARMVAHHLAKVTLSVNKLLAVAVKAVAQLKVLVLDKMKIIK
jgi:hypothetical protein